MQAAIYLRQSLDRTAEGQAVARQRQDCERLAAQRGWQVTAVYEDNDVSASSGKTRPAYERLLADLRAKRIDAVVAWSSDRLHRRLIDLVGFVAAVNTAQALVATVTSGDIDLATPHGRMLAGILGSVAQAEVEQKGLRQQRANQQRAEAGQPRFTRRPYGYAPDGRTVVEHEAAVIQQAAAALLAGTSLRDEAAQLNTAGLPTSTGAAWSVTSLRRAVTSPRVAGLNVYRGQVLGQGDWPAILTTDVHHAVSALLSDPARRTATSNVRKYLLSGLLRCGVCGEPMYATPAGRGQRTWQAYRCRTPHNSRRLDLVDAVVEQTVIARLSRPDVSEPLDVGPATEVEQGLRSETAALRLRLDEAARLFADGVLTGTQLQTASKQLRRRLAELESQLPRKSSSVLQGLAGPDMATRWRELPLSRKRAVIDLLMTVTVLPAGKGVRFRPEQVAVAWRSPLIASSESG